MQANIQNFISCMNLCTFVPLLDFLDPFFDLKSMHTCSGAQIKLNMLVNTPYLICSKPPYNLNLGHFSALCFWFVFVSWSIGITITSIMGFPFLSGSYKFASWVLYILGFIDISKCSCFVLLKNKVTFYRCLPSWKTWVICQIFVKLLWNFCHQSWLIMFWTKIMGTSSLKNALHFIMSTNHLRGDIFFCNWKLHE